MTDVLLRIEQLRISEWIRESSSLLAFPTLLFLHTLGMSIVAGASSVIELRDGAFQLAPTANAQTAFLDWYKRQARTVLTERVRLRPSVRRDVFGFVRL